MIKKVMEKMMEKRMKKTAEQENQDLGFKVNKNTVKKAVILAMVCILGSSLKVHAFSGLTDTTVVTESFQTLYDIVAAVISSLGLIITLWGISEMGMSYQSTDGVMQAQSLKRIGGGLIMIVAPNLLPLLA